MKAVTRILQVLGKIYRENARGIQRKDTLSVGGL